MAILGHNGSGKSTFAKHCNALLTPTQGKLWVDGLDTSDPDNLLAIRGTVGMVFQNPDNQIVASVVEEDVAFGPENMGIPPEEIRKRVDTALKMVGMYEWREHAPHPQVHRFGRGHRHAGPGGPAGNGGYHPHPE